MQEAVTKIGNKAKVSNAEKRRATKAAKAVVPLFPAKTTINAYKFLSIPAKVMEALGIKGATRVDGKAIFDITKATITGYDAQTRVLSIQLREP